MNAQHCARKFDCGDYTITELKKFQKKLYNSTFDFSSTMWSVVERKFQTALGSKNEKNERPGSVSVMNSSSFMKYFNLV
jgi:hypothetical protein